MINNSKQKLIIIFAILIAAVFMMEPLYGNIDNNNSQPSVSTNVAVPVSTYTSSSPTPYTYPTNLTGEPGYTGGTYKLAQVGNPDYFNPFEASTVCDFYVLDNIYSTATTTPLTNNTVIPCLATSYTETAAPANMTTFDPMTGATSHVVEIYTVHIRPGVQWDDWTAANAKDAYVYSNHTSFYNDTGVHYSHTYTKVYNATSGKNQTESSITMKTYYVQAADFILSWKILSASADFSGSYIGVVNVMPLNNLTVEYYLSVPSATFVPYTLETFILPYHVWVSHDYAGAGTGYWNETNVTSATPASGAYNTWDLGHVSGTGEYPGLVGTGPFMMNGGYGLPMGKYFHDDYWQVYENPNYFMQYIDNSKYAWLTDYYHEMIPKIFSEKVYIFSGPSAAVGALSTGKVDAIESNVGSEFLSTLDTIPNVKIYEKPSTGYAYFKFNSYSADAPFNITTFRQALRYASPLAYIDSSICDGFVVPGSSILPTIDTPYSISSVVPVYTFDQTKANSTIATIPGMHYKNGEWYYNGKEVTATIQSPSSSLIPQIFTGYELIAKDWSKIGIKTTVESESFATIISKFDAYGNSAKSPSASYNLITLGISGLLGDPIGDLIDFYNYTDAIGTGDYEGPFSAMNVSNPYLSDLGVKEDAKLGVVNTVTYDLTGKEIDSLMANLSSYANTNSSVINTRYAMDAMQYIEDEESTMMEIGYGPEDVIAYSNTTFTGITHYPSDMNGFWYHNLMTVHLRSKALVVTKPTAHLEVTGVPNKLVYYNGEYGNITFTAINNATGKPVADQSISISPEPSLINITALKNVTTNSAGQYRYEFKVYSHNQFINIPGYSGAVDVSATVVSSITGVASGIGTAVINDLPYPVAYNVNGITVVNSTYQYYNITVYNPVTGKPISGYAYTIQTLTAAINMKNTSSNQKLSYLSTYDAAYNSTSMYIPLNKTAHSDNITSISGVTGSNGIISVMVKTNSTFNFTLNGNNYQSYIFIGNYADAAPVYGESPYMVLGQVTSSENENGFGTGEPFEVPIMLEKSINNYKITVEKKTINSVTTEFMFKVTDNGAAVSGYMLNVTSQNTLGANRGYFINSNESAIDPNYYLTESCGPDTGSHYEPMATLKTNSNGIAYANFTSLYYAYNTTTGTISPASAPASETMLPFDEFQINVVGDGAPAVAYATATSNATNTYKVTFTETGLPSGAIWYVNLTNGMKSGPITASSYSFATINGTYSYTITTANKNYGLSKSSGSFTVNGKSVTVDISFTKKVNYTDYYIIGGVIAAIIVVGGVVYALKRKSKAQKQN